MMNLLYVRSLDYRVFEEENDGIALHLTQEQRPATALNFGQ